MFAVLLTCTQLACATGDGQRGIRDAKIEHSNEIDLVYREIRLGMSKKEVYARLLNVRWSGSPARVYWHKKDVLLVERNDGKLSDAYIFGFEDGKLHMKGIFGP
jgi:hypothetical protein